MEAVKWIVLVLVTVFYFYRTHKIGKRPGFLSGIDVIVPTFFYFIFIIGWLILFFIVL